jgi:3-methylcrotonyl-CoA carboxylase alpha subunit
MWWPGEHGGLRVDRGFETGDVVPSLYDSLLGKIIAHGESREAALERLIEGVQSVRVHGVASNAPWLARALREPDFRKGEVSTAFVAIHGDALAVPADPTTAAAFAGAAHTWTITPKHAVASPWELADGFRAGLASVIRVPLSIGGRNLDVAVVAFSLRPPRCASLARPFISTGVATAHRSSNGLSAAAGSGRAREASRSISVWVRGELFTFDINDGSQFESASAARAGGLTRPCQGYRQCRGEGGRRGHGGQTLLVVEAMKMEHAIKAPRAGTVTSLKHGVGDRVREGSTLAEIE